MSPRNQRKQRSTAVWDFLSSAGKRPDCEQNFFVQLGLARSQFGVTTSILLIGVVTDFEGAKIREHVMLITNGEQIEAFCSAVSGCLRLMRACIKWC